MGWQDRIKEAAYTSPKGDRLPFHYEDVSRLIVKKTTAFDFPDADGTYIQDLGVTSRRYPIRLFFWGSDHDTEALAFEEALALTGIGTLEHPMYGVVKVVPFGEIRRRDELKTAANQTIIDVRFFETTGVLFPINTNDIEGTIQATLLEYNINTSANFMENLSLDSALESVNLKSDYLVSLAGASTLLTSVADAQDDTRIQFNAILDSITTSIDSLVAEPLTLAAQTALLIQTPALAAAPIGERLAAYTALITAVLSSGVSTENANTFYNRDLYAMTYVSGVVVAVMNNQFETKTAALLAAEAVLSLFESVALWRDDNFQALDSIDTGEAYQSLQEATALAAGFLVEISFTLKQEKSRILTRDRTVVDIVAEFYGSVDDNLDEFINANDLSGDEIVTLPMGRKVVYYV